MKVSQGFAKHLVFMLFCIVERISCACMDMASVNNKSDGQLAGQEMEGGTS